MGISGGSIRCGKPADARPTRTSGSDSILLLPEAQFLLPGLAKPVWTGGFASSNQKYAAHCRRNNPAAWVLAFVAFPRSLAKLVVERLEEEW